MAKGLYVSIKLARVKVVLGLLWLHGQHIKVENVIFLTVKADLFTDFWRDVMDIGKDHLFPAPYIMNANGRIRDHSTMKPLFSAPKPAEKQSYNSFW